MTIMDSLSNQTLVQQVKRLLDHIKLEALSHPFPTPPPPPLQRKEKISVDPMMWYALESSRCLKISFLLAKEPRGKSMEGMDKTLEYPTTQQHHHIIQIRNSYTWE